MGKKTVGFGWLLWLLSNRTIETLVGIKQTKHLLRLEHSLAFCIETEMAVEFYCLELLLPVGGDEQ